MGKPRIFISAVSSEFKQVRQIVAQVLERLGYDPVRQDIFGTEPGDLRQMLREKIDDCEGLIHIVGRGYGAEPLEIDETLGRVSYTQFEFLYAQQRKKKTWIVFAEKGCSRDTPLERLDLPLDPNYSDPAAYQAERRALQDAWRGRLGKAGHLHHGAASDTELELRIERLKDEFAALRREERSWRRRVTWTLVVVAALVLLSAGIAGFVAFRQGQTREDVSDISDTVKSIPNATAAQVAKLYEDPDVLTGKLKSHIRKRAEEKIAEARNIKDDWRKIDEIEKRRKEALDYVDEIVQLIREGLVGDPDPIFSEAAHILAIEGVDEALKYLESKQPEIEDRVNSLESIRDQGEVKLRSALAIYLMQAELHETNFAMAEALKLYQVVADKAPNWSRARRELGKFLLEHAHYADAETELKVALEFARNDQEQLLAARQLGLLYVDTASWKEAEPLLATSLELSESQFGPDSPSTATALSSIGMLLHHTNRLGDAEACYRRALAIGERSYGPKSPNVATLLSNVASLLDATNRPAEAELLVRRALAIDEKSYGAEHPIVASTLNNLASLLFSTSRKNEAEPLFRRELAIYERYYGGMHPNVAISLTNLAMLLKYTDRPVEAESLYRRALAIDEESFGVEHPRVGIDLNNLGRLIQSTRRYSLAEPLLRHSLTIWHKSGKISGHEQSQMSDGLNNYRGLLKSMELSTDEIEHRVVAAMDGSAPLDSISREIETLLGPAKPVAEVLATLDQQYQAAGKSPAHLLPSDEPISPHLAELLKPSADALNSFGFAAFQKGANADAIVMYEEALRLYAEQPVDAQDVLRTRMNRAAALRDLGEIRQACDELRQLVSVLESDASSSALATGRARYNLALCEWRIGDRAAAQREAEDSLHAYSQATEKDAIPEFFKDQTRKLIEDIKQNNPLVPLRQIDTETELAKARKLFQARKNLATLSLDQAIVPILDEILGPSLFPVPPDQPIAPYLTVFLGPANLPADTSAQRDLSNSYIELGDMRRQAGDLDQALVYFQKALEISKKLVAADPNQVSDQHNLSVSYFKLGDVSRQAGDLESALEYFQNVQEIAGKLAAADPNSASAQQKLSISYFKLGEVNRQAGFLEQAREYFRKDLEIAIKLAAVDPSSAKAQRDLSISYEILGDVSQQADDLDKAREHFQKALDIREKLAATDPADADAQHDLMVLLWKSGGLRQAQLAYSAAAQDFEAAIDILDRMIAAGKLVDQCKSERESLVENRDWAKSQITATGDWDVVLAQPVEMLPSLLSIRVTELAKQQRMDDVAQAASKLSMLEPKTATNLYNAACGFSLCAASLIAEQDQERGSDFVAKALEALRAAVDAGFDDFEHMAADSDLATLRRLPEFQKMLKPVEEPKRN